MIPSEGVCKICISLKVPEDGVRRVKGTTVVSLELALDLRRLLPLKARLILCAVVCDPEVASESLSSEELDVSDELEEFNISANRPG